MSRKKTKEELDLYKKNMKFIIKKLDMKKEQIQIKNRDMNKKISIYPSAFSMLRNYTYPITLKTFLKILYVFNISFRIKRKNTKK